MSFGFSVGDNILCTQIAYRLFSSIADGRKKAPRDLKELEDTLFGLYCALSHLERDHEIILAKASTNTGENHAQVHVQLDYMIKSCRETLEELNNVTVKYREAALESDLPVSGKQPALLRLSSPRPAKGSLKIQLKRVLWDLHGESLSKYRSKLQSHTDAINLLLSTFIWSATDRMEKNDAQHSQKLDQILKEASQINDNILQLVQALHASMMTPQPPGPHDLLQSGECEMHAPLALGANQVTSIVSKHEDINYGSSQPPNPTPQALVALPSRPAEESQKPEPSSSARTLWPKHQYLQLPEKIQLINEYRQIVGEKELKQRQKQLTTVTSDHDLPISPDTSRKKGVPAVNKLNRQLENIFKTLKVPEAGRMTTNQDLSSDIVAWVFSLEDLADQLHASPPIFDTEEKSAILGELSELLVSLNRHITRLIVNYGGENRMVFYDACGPRIDHVFMKFRILSTFCEKEIEIFEDDRDYLGK